MYISIALNHMIAARIIKKWKGAKNLISCMKFFTSSPSWARASNCPWNFKSRAVASGYNMIHKILKFNRFHAGLFNYNVMIVNFLKISKWTIHLSIYNSLQNFFINHILLITFLQVHNVDSLFFWYEMFIIKASHLLIFFGIRYSALIKAI